jgi:toxin ParE1/3/4
VLEIRRSPAARDDAVAIWLFIAEDNVGAAEAMLDRIDAVLRMLAEQPRAGRLRPELHPGLRSFPVGSYTVFYEADDEALTVVRILSAYRDLDPDMFEA